MLQDPDAVLISNIEKNYWARAAETIAKLLELNRKEEAEPNIPSDSARGRNHELTAPNGPK
ncbi:hypothetical protein [Propionivibrio sp.]|uniref:hypothetical protein n=1 Tax=Propionivibrio sp. TaxID=2212460 RepID=UPI002624DCC4|nr:hypothetical protein [Propionivibrio sp.]